MMTLTPTHPDVTVRLSDTDGNVFAVIGAVTTALKRAGRHAEAQQFKRDCWQAGSYHQVLSLALRTVNVE